MGTPEARTLTITPSTQTLAWSGGPMSVGHQFAVAVAIPATETWQFEDGHTYRLTAKRTGELGGTAITYWAITVTSATAGTIALDLSGSEFTSLIGDADWLPVQWGVDDLSYGPMGVEQVGGASLLGNRAYRAGDSAPTNTSENTYTDDEIDALIAGVEAGAFDMSSLDARVEALGASTLLAVQDPGEDVPKKASQTQAAAWFSSDFSAATHASGHTDGTDDIQSATNAQKGVATAAQITALEAATAAQHTQGTDTGLDSGGSNPVTAANLKAHIEGTGSPHTALGVGADYLHGIYSGLDEDSLSWNDTTHVLTLTDAHVYYYLGTAKSVDAGNTCDLDDFTLAEGLWYVYYDDAGGTLTASQTPWDIFTDVLVATVFWNGSTGAVSPELHGARRDLHWHYNQHRFVGAKIASSEWVLTAPSAGSPSTISVSGGTVADEDYRITHSTLTNCRIWYQTGAESYTFANSDSVYPTNVSFVDSDNSYTLTAVDAGQYINCWAYVSTDKDRGLYIVLETKGSSGYANANLARAAAPPNLSTFGMSPEMRLAYRFILKGDESFTESTDYRASEVVPAAGGTFVPTAAGVSFVPSGNIAATNVQTAIEELDSEKLPASVTLAELNSAVSDATLDDSGDSRTPSTHASSHQSGGADAIKLDDLSAPDDNTDLNVSTSAHGLAPKLPDDATKFLNGEGSYTVPPGAGDVVGPASATDSAIALFDGTTGKLLKDSTKAATPAGIGALPSSFTLAELNTAISDATVDATSGTRDPTAHASEHTDGTDDIQSATNAQKGLATSTHITTIEKLDASYALHKLDATDAPTVNEDTGDGYSVGSFWLDVTNDNAYVCMDASSGAAVWEQINGSGGGTFSGSSGSVDNAIMRADGTGGATLQASNLVADDYEAGTQANVGLQAQHDSESNVALRLQPKGTGALIAGPAPDGTSTGGDARGIDAVDWQRARTSAAHVASGAYAVVGGGYRNKASAQKTTVAGGDMNSATWVGDTVPGGRGNVASGGDSFAAGQYMNATALCSFGLGYRGKADLQGQLAISAGQYVTAGDRQTSIISLTNSTSGTSQTDLFLNGSSARAVLRDGQSWLALVLFQGRQADGSSGCAMRVVQIYREGTTTALVGSVQTLGSDNWDTNLGTPTVTVAADDTNEALQIAVTPANSTATRWHASLLITELGY